MVIHYLFHQHFIHLLSEVKGWLTRTGHNQVMCKEMEKNNAI